MWAQPGDYSVAALPAQRGPPAASADVLRPNRRLRLLRGFPASLSRDCLHRCGRPTEPAYGSQIPPMPAIWVTCPHPPKRRSRTHSNPAPHCPSRGKTVHHAPPQGPLGKVERRQTAGDWDPPRFGRDQRLPVGPGTGGLSGYLSARAGRVPPTAAQRITGETQEEGEEGKSAPEDFLAFAREKVRGYKRRGQIGTFRSYRTTCRKFTVFIEETYGRKEVSFGALEAELFREFRTYCYEERGSGTNTAQRELSVSHALVRHARRKGSSRRTRSSTS